MATMKWILMANTQSPEIRDCFPQGPRRGRCGPDWQRRRGQTDQAAGAVSGSGRAALEVPWSVHFWCKGGTVRSSQGAAVLCLSDATRAPDSRASYAATAHVAPATSARVTPPLSVPCRAVPLRGALRMPTRHLTRP
jgi:hypothetical protein